MAEKNMPKKDVNEEEASRNRVHFYWETPEYKEHKRDVKWYVIGAAILLFFVLYGIATGSASMAIVFILLGGVYYITAEQKPKNVHVIISELGIHFGHRYYPYNTIESFWVLYHPPEVTTLNIQLMKGALRTISIQLSADENPGDIRDFLLTQLPEREGQEEGFFDAISRKFKL